MSRKSVAILADTEEHAHRIAGAHADFIGSPDDVYLHAITPNSFGQMTGLKVDKVIFGFSGDRTPVKTAIEDSIHLKISARGKDNVETLTITKGEAL